MSVANITLSLSANNIPHSRDTRLFVQYVQAPLPLVFRLLKGYKSGKFAVPTSIDGNPTFQSTTDHRSSKNALSQAAGVKAGIVESKAPMGAFGDSKSTSCWATSPVAVNGLLLLGSGTPLDDSSGRNFWIRAIICSTAALVLLTGSCDPNRRRSRRPVHSISKQLVESSMLSCTVASASTRHALSR